MRHSCAARSTSPRGSPLTEGIDHQCHDLIDIHFKRPDLKRLDAKGAQAAPGAGAKHHPQKNNDDLGMVCDSMKLPNATITYDSHEYGNIWQDHIRSVIFHGFSIDFPQPPSNIRSVKIWIQSLAC